MPADLLPIRMKASATRAVPESFAKFLIIARGRKMATSPRIIHWIGMNVLQSVTASTKACRFWAIKMVYAGRQLQSGETHDWQLTAHESNLRYGERNED